MPESVTERIMQMQRVRRVLWVVWPAFLVAGVAEAVFFTVFDPFDLHFFGEPLELSRQAIYTLGFFGFWGMGIATSALTMFFEHPPGTADDEDR
jgi:hypothetical protein